MFGHNDNQQTQTDDVSMAAPAHDGTGDGGHTDVNLELPGSQTAASTFPPSGTPTVDPTAAPTATPSSSPVAAPAVPEELLNLKQEALQQLSPLVSHLDQTPEERFRTTMMMIQATDDQTKLREAYDAAKQITDDKVRAQALLDVVNEINYFTQQHQNNGDGEAA